MWHLVVNLGTKHFFLDPIDSIIRRGRIRPGFEHAKKCYKETSRMISNPSDFEPETTDFRKSLDIGKTNYCFKISPIDGVWL